MIKLSSLNCDQCKKQFDLYCEPKYLSCGKTICTRCEFNICREAIKKRFKCAICTQYHDIPVEGFLINEEIYSKIKTESIELHKEQSKESSQFEINLIETKSLIEWLENFETECINILYEHCLEQKRLVQLETEFKIQKLITKESENNNSQEKIDKLNELNEELIEVIDDYEQKCKGEFLCNSSSIKETLNELINSTNIFLNEKQDYLKQNEANYDEISKTNNEFLSIQSKLNQKIIKFKNIIFNSNKIEYYNNETDELVLGYFDYDKCLTVCFKLLYYAILIYIFVCYI
jgi:hypothetical protein